MHVDAQQQFTATASYADGGTVVLTAGVTWVSSATDILSIDANTGLATAIAHGSAIVSATFGGITQSASVTVRTHFDEVALGREHALGITKAGTLWAWGRNHWGQLGDGTSTDSGIPVRVGTDRNWRQVAVGDSHSLAIRADGSLWAWGLNQNGQLGLGDLNPRSSPVRVGTLSTWASVAAGSTHSVALQRDGKLFTWGRNHYGQLGQETSTAPKVKSPDLSVPTPVGTDKTWDKITAAADHTLASRRDRSIWAWGRNDSSQLGLRDLSQIVIIPTQIDFEGEPQPRWSWIAISTGSTHTLAIRSDGALFSWGNGADGRLGRLTGGPTDLPQRVGADSDWVSVSAGDAHSLAIRRDGSLWSWGANDRGQLGDETVLGPAGRFEPDSIQVPASPNWTKVRAGYKSSAALSSEETLWVWGDDSNGQLGLATAEEEDRLRSAPSTLEIRPSP
jgi:alpha-tubulin suppressor-like RCC1 family protein